MGLEGDTWCNGVLQKVLHDATRCYTVVQGVMWCYKC